MDKHELIRRAAEHEICPECDAPLDEERVGSGALADGVFCNLDCQIRFHEDYYRERRDFGQPHNN
jgi:hypothetical protein